MLILKFSGADMIFLVLCVCFISTLIGWIADNILRGSGLGLLWNSIFCALGGTAGLFVLDYIATYQYFPYYVARTHAWLLSGVFGGASLLVIASFINLLLSRRNASA